MLFQPLFPKFNILFLDTPAQMGIMDKEQRRRAAGKPAAGPLHDFPGKGGVSLQRLLLIFSCIILVILFALQGFQPQYRLPTSEQLEEDTVYEEGDGPEQALAEIYFDVEIMGVQEATSEKLESEFGLDPSIWLSVHGRYTNGRFGIADVFMIRPRVGYEDEVREALETIKLSRMNLFRNFDVYNSLSIAENGSIYRRGDYYILLMIEDEERAREIISQYIPR